MGTFATGLLGGHFMLKATPIVIPVRAGRHLWDVNVSAVKVMFWASYKYSVTTRGATFGFGMGCTHL